jgi:hypothetical protein
VRELRKAIGEEYPEVLVLPSEYDSALLGMVSRANGLEVACYDYHKVIHVLEKRHGMTNEDAIEYFEFNILGAYMGAYTPCFLNNNF